MASFCRWAVRHDLLPANPMDKMDTIKVPRPAAAADVAAVLAVICSRRPRKDLPLDRLRDRVLFETAYVCGARAAEVCGLTWRTWTCFPAGSMGPVNDNADGRAHPGIACAAVPC